MTKKCPKCKSDMTYEESNNNSPVTLSSGSGFTMNSSCSANKSDGGCWRCDKCGYIINIDKGA